MVNLVPAESSGFETTGSVGDWEPWYSCTIAQTTAEAADGTGSLQMDITASNGAAIMTVYGGWPVTVTPGDAYAVGVKVKGPAGATFTLELTWLDSSNGDLTTASVEVATDGASFVAGSADTTVPEGATAISMDASTAVDAGAVFYVDTITVTGKGGGVVVPKLTSRLALATGLGGSLSVPVASVPALTGRLGLRTGIGGVLAVPPARVPALTGRLGLRTGIGGRLSVPAARVPKLSGGLRLRTGLGGALRRPSTAPARDISVTAGPVTAGWATAEPTGGWQAPAMGSTVWSTEPPRG